MDNPDIRWRQRFASYQKALLQLQTDTAVYHRFAQYRQLGNTDLVAHIDRIGVVIYNKIRE